MADLRQETLNLSPFAYYRCIEASGTTAVDSSTSALNGTYASNTLGGPPLTYNTPASVYFNATTGSGRLTTGVTTSNTNIAGASVTVSFWVKLATLIGGTYALYCGNGNTNSVTTALGFQVYSNATSLILAARATTAAYQAATITTTMATGRLYHIVGVIDGTGSKLLLYLNNVVSAAGTYARPGTPTMSFAFGDSIAAGSATPVNGWMGECALFPSALTAANVNTLYTAGIRAMATMQAREFGLWH